MATKGHSTIIEYGDQPTFAASTAWTPFLRLLEITPPNIEADDIETTHMLSPDQFKQYSAGWADGGEVEFQVQYEKQKNTEVLALFRQDKGFRVLFADPAPSGSRWKFDGYIKGFGNEVERGGLITTNVTIKVSGKPEFETV